MTKPGLRCALGGSLLITALTLTGCGGLLGGGGKADLYRFGNTAAPALGQSPASVTQPVLVFYPGSSFQPAIQGDRILTVAGSQARYIAGARWVSPAADLFDAATVAELERLAPTVRVIRSGEFPSAEYILVIDVRHFEASYTRGVEMPPDVIVNARAKLIRRSDRSIVGEWPVAHSEPAQDNRVTAIVSAFERGTAAVTGQIATLTQQSLATRP